MIVSFTADVIGGTGGVPNVTLEINNPPDFLAQYPYLAAVESDLNAGSGDLELSNSDK
jgi:hypothetical protein